jgi:hypothetical protein
MADERSLAEDRWSLGADDELRAIAADADRARPDAARRWIAHHERANPSPLREIARALFRDEARRGAR